MTHALRRRPTWLGFFVLLGAIVAIEGWVVSSVHFRRSPEILAGAVTADLILLPPALGWFFLIRTRRLPVFSLIPMTALGVVLAILLVPEEHRHALRSLETIAPAIELGILGLVALRARKAIRHYRAVRATHADAIDALEESLGVALDSPRAGAMLATELTILRYGVAGWFTKSPPTGGDDFSYHRRASYPAVLGVLSLVMAMELLGVHFLLMRWSSVAAWIATGLGIYSALWLYGDFHAGRLHPIRVMGDGLHLRTGFRWKIRLPFDEIAALHDAAPDVQPRDRVAFVFFGKPDFWLELRRPLEVRGIFGITRTVRWLGLGADDAAALRRRLDEAIARS